MNRRDDSVASPSTRRRTETPRRGGRAPGTGRERLWLALLLPLLLSACGSNEHTTNDIAGPMDVADVAPVLDARIDDIGDTRRPGDASDPTPDTPDGLAVHDAHDDVTPDAGPDISWDIRDGVSVDTAGPDVLDTVAVRDTKPTDIPDVPSFPDALDIVGPLDTEPQDIGADTDGAVQTDAIESDATPDTTEDTTAPPSCTAGPCCRDGVLAPVGVTCHPLVAQQHACEPPGACGAVVLRRTADRVCSGESAWCDGPIGPWSEWEEVFRCGLGTVCNAATGSCQPTANCACAARCDDADPCTVDSCDLDGSCLHTPWSCDDDNPCTLDQCVAGTGCVFTPWSCDDGDPCTVDTCEAWQGCVSTPLTCDDGDPCTADTCRDGVCVSYSLYVPNPNLPTEPCTHRSCTEESGPVVEVEPDDTPCQRSGVTGVCRAGVCCAPDCHNRECGPDGCGGSCGDCGWTDPCAPVRCSDDGQCVMETIECVDDLACTVDRCQAGVCLHDPNHGACDDGIACTVDRCVQSEGGCVHDDRACDCEEDDHPGHHDVDTALVLAPGVHHISGTVSSGVGDWWRVEMQSGMQLTARLQAPAGDDKAALPWLWYGGGSEQWNAVAAGESGVSASARCYAPATFYLWVHTGSHPFPCLEYELHVEVTEPPADPLTCNDVCPDLPCYTPHCNAQGYCEYVPDAERPQHDTQAVIWIPSGDTHVGPEGQAYVRFADGYWIDKYEVTAEEVAYVPDNALYSYWRCDAPEACTVTSVWPGEPIAISEHCQDEPDGPTGACDGHPATPVTYWQAEAHCTWTGGALCTEAQWERAARGVDLRTYPWGEAPGPGDEDWQPARANCAEEICADGYLHTAPVDAFPDDLSATGCVGMAGNVAEWVADYWDGFSGQFPELFPDDGSAWNIVGVPWVPPTARVIRGSSWKRILEDGDALLPRHGAARTWEWIGFRCCRTPASLTEFWQDNDSCACKDSGCP